MNSICPESAGILIWITFPLLILFITILMIVTLIKSLKIDHLGLSILIIPMLTSSILLGFILYDISINPPKQISAINVYVEFNEWKYRQLSDYQQFSNISSNCDLMFDPYSLDRYWLHNTKLVCNGINLQFEHKIEKIMEYQAPLYFITRYL